MRIPVELGGQQARRWMFLLDAIPLWIVRRPRRRDVWMR